MAANRKKIVIIGATSAIAEYCARFWVNSTPEVDIWLIARNKTKLDIIASDLEVRNPKAQISTRTLDFAELAAIKNLADDLCRDSVPDITLIAFGSLPEQQDCQDSLEKCQEALVVNGLLPVLCMEAFAIHLERANKGTLAVIGSVAGDRGRKSNYVYGSAKGLINRYVQGLQHRFAKSAVQAVLIKPGPTDTPMTSTMKAKGLRLANVEDVAQIIVAGIGKGKPVIYAPAKWSLIMMIIRHLPGFIFNKLNI